MARRERHGKFCRFCQDKVVKIDYKDEKRLLRFVTEQGGEGTPEDTTRLKDEFK